MTPAAAKDVADDEAPESAPLPSAAPLFSLRVAYALAVLSGVMYFLGVPGVNVWPMAFVTLVPLLVALRGRAPRDAAKLGLVAGFVASLLGFHWLYGMFQRFSGLPGPACALLMIAMCAYQGGRLAFTAWLTARADARGWPGAIAFVLASTTAELVYPLLFPWYLAFMMHETPLLMQTADLGGVYLAGALLLGPNLAIAELVSARLSRVRPNRNLVLAGLCAPLLGAAYGAYRIKQVEALAAAAPAVKVGVAQGNLPLITRAGGVGVHRRLTEKLRGQGANLVVWSEGAIPDILDEATYKQSAQRITRDLEVPVIFGATLRRRSSGAVRDLNSALVSNFDGAIIGRYDKHYLLPFGEFIPFGESFPSLYDRLPNAGHMIPGESVAPLDLTGHPISVLICYEDILPWFVNQAVSEGKPELLVNIAIDTWFGDSIEPWEHLALGQLRAVEHRRFLVRAANTGVSAIVDPAGRVVKHGGLFQEDSFVSEVRLMTPATVYERVGDLPFYAGAVAIGIMAVRRRRQAA
ncbi:Apolipoprotein N-acyltransferase [Minicystis rosea]|nr:Apolipoprotein N-acyltransferase [Minicystis rosea]